MKLFVFGLMDFGIVGFEEILNNFIV